MNPNKCINTFHFTLEQGGTVWGSVVDAAAQANTPLSENQIAAETNQVLVEQQIGGPTASLKQRHTAARDLPVGYNVTVILDAPSCEATSSNMEATPTTTVPTLPTKKGSLFLENQPFSLLPQNNATPSQTSTMARPPQPETHTANSDPTAAIVFTGLVLAATLIRSARRKLFG